MPLTGYCVSSSSSGPPSMTDGGSSEEDGMENWLRLNLIEEKCLRQAVNDVMHNKQGDPSYIGLPTDGAQLYNKMVEFRGSRDGQHLTSVKKIKEFQWEMLCPPPPLIVSDSADWDTPVMVFPIRYKTTLPHPVGGWGIRNASSTDDSKAANIYRARDLRNEIKHNRPSKYSEKNYYDNEIHRVENILCGLDYQDMDLFNRLKTVSLEVYAKELVNIVKTALDKKTQDIIIQINDITKIGTYIQEASIDYHNNFALINSKMKQWASQFQQHVDDDLTDLKKLQKDMFAATKCTVDRVVDRVWELMFENKSISIDDWIMLAHRFGVHLERQENKKNCIKNSLRNQDISWERLKTVLYEMDKADVVECLKKKTNLTEGFTTVMEEHKRRMFEKTKRKTTHSEFVDLAVVESHIVERRWRNNADEKEFPYMKFNVPRTAYNNISLGELIDHEDCFVVINGIAGIGKSTLCEEITHEWSAGRLWNGTNGQPNVPLLLSISCPMMNVKQFESLEQFISYLLPQLDDHKLLEDKKALLLIDAADELQGIENLSSSKTESTVNLFREVINFPVQRFFNKIIITCRPKIASQLRQFCKKEIKVKTKNVDVTGFSSESIRLFVEKQFQQNPDIPENILTRITANSMMEAMASIPIFLKSYCELFSEKNSSIPTPSTMTELLLYTILNFFKSYKWKQCEDLSIRALARNEEVVNHVISLAELSYKTLTEKKVIFFQDDFGIDFTILNLLEQVGFITKTKDPMEGDIYQYRHLTFQEIFTALFIIRANRELQLECFKNENLRGTLPLVSGLEGILKRATSRTDHLKTFVRKVAKHSPKSDVKIFLENSLKEGIDPVYYKCQSENLELPSQEFIDREMKCLSIDNNTLVRESTLKFWTHTLPHINNDFEFTLYGIKKSDSVKQLAIISCKSNYLDLHIQNEDDVEDWIGYFKEISDHWVGGTVEITANRWGKDVCDDYARFLRHSHFFYASGDTLPWLKYLVDGFQRKVLSIQTLAISTDNICSDTLEMIQILFKYIPTIHVYDLIEDFSKLNV